MKLVADKYGRIRSSKLFPLHTAFHASRQTGGSIRIVKFVEKEVPVVKPIRTREGFLMLPVKASRASILAALRADRAAASFPPGSLRHLYAKASNRAERRTAHAYTGKVGK